MLNSVQTIMTAFALPAKFAPGTRQSRSPRRVASAIPAAIAVSAASTAIVADILICWLFVVIAHASLKQTPPR